MNTIGTGAGKVGLTFQIGSVQYETINFFSDDAHLVPLDVSHWTFEFFIKANEGSRTKIISLTLGASNGITFVTYSDTGILIKITNAQSLLFEEGEYYWELRRTDLDIPLLYGPANFNFRASL